VVFGVCLQAALPGQSLIVTKRSLRESGTLNRGALTLGPRHRWCEKNDGEARAYLLEEQRMRKLASGAIKLMIGALEVAVLLGAGGCTPEPKSSADVAAKQPELVTPLTAVAAAPTTLPPTPGSVDYTFVGGYPTAETVRQAYDAADLNRALQCYRFFYPSVAIMATWKANLRGGAVPNHVFVLLEGTPEQLVFTPNSDTPYAGLPLDLSIGPIVVELPAGPIMSSSNDMNQRWVMDMGLPGPDKGKGGKHLFLPPGYKGPVPAGYHAATSTTNRVLVLLRALPTAQKTANEQMQSVKVYPLERPNDWKEPTWISLNKPGLDFTPLTWEDNLKFWVELYDLIEREPAFAEYRNMYGELAELGIAKGKPFAPDARLEAILTKAAQMGNAMLRVQSFADRRPESVVWSDRAWQWAVLRPENGNFDTESYSDNYARQKWLYQAQIQSPAMFSRAPGAGSLYWLGARDRSGAYLDGAKTYKLTVPQPVPAKLFWSVTVYDAVTRSEIATQQNRAALRSLVELEGREKEPTVELYFGPQAPAGHEKDWIQTIPGKGWFVYFRLYGPESAAFDGTWKPGDFELLR
jgi:hypothetical protein